MLIKHILKIWTNYLGGQFLLTLITGGVTYLTGILTGLYAPEVNAIIAGICENVPNFGAVISIMTSAIFALVKGSSALEIKNWQFALLIAGILIVVQLLQNYLISPLLIGKSMDIPPLLVFVGMAVFSALFGFVGMIFAVPLMGTLREIVRYRFYYDDFYGDEK